MAQHDYNIANDTAPSVRADINNALSAISSQNSGATAPSTTFANMIWYDSSNNILKMRNEGDDAWIDLFDLNQVSDTATPSTLPTTNLSFEFIASTDASNNASINFTGFDDTKYDSYYFTLANIIPSADANFICRTSTNGGSSYDNGSTDYDTDMSDLVEPTESNSIPLHRTSTFNVGSDTGEDGWSGHVEVIGPHLTNRRTLVKFAGGYITETGNSSWDTGMGWRDTQADVDAIQFLFSTGNVESGTITMYGLRNSV